jgi:hypothetical protein
MREIKEMAHWLYVTMSFVAFLGLTGGAFYGLLKLIGAI